MLKQIVALYNTVVPVLYSGCTICIFASYTWDAHAAKDGLLYPHVDLIYQETEV